MEGGLFVTAPAFRTRSLITVTAGLHQQDTPGRQKSVSVPMNCFVGAGVRKWDSAILQSRYPADEDMMLTILVCAA